MAKQITDKCVALFKYNASVSASNAITLISTPFLTPDVKSQEYKEIGSGKLGQSKTYVDEQNTTVEFDLELMLRGNDKTGKTPTTIPAVAELLKSCGLSQTIGTNDVVYSPNHDYISPSEAKVYIDDYARKVSGAISNMKISGAVGECAKIVFNVSGFTTPQATAQKNPTVTLDTQALMIVSKISAITLDGTTLNVENFEFDLGNENVNVYAVGVSEFIRKDFAPKITLSGIKTKGDETGWTDLVASSVKKIVITLGNAVGKQVTINASQANTSQMSEQDNDGMVNFSRTFILEGDAKGDNHFSIKWH